MITFDFRQRGGPELIQWLHRTGETQIIPAGTQLIKEGELAESLLFVLDGDIQASTNDVDNREVRLNRLKAGAVLGEMSWLEQRPAVADIVAFSPIELLKVPFASILQLERTSCQLAGQLYRLLAQKLALQIQHQNTIFASQSRLLSEPLRKVLTFFAHLKERDIHRLAEIGHLKRIEPGSLLIKQGEIVTALYLILSGDGEILVKLEGASQQVGRAQRGELVGEMSLLLEEQQGASTDVLASGGLDLLSIDRVSLAKQLATDPALECRFHKALACMLSQRSRDQLLRHQLSQNSHSRESQKVDNESLDIQQLEAISRGARHFDWICNHYQKKGSAL